MSDLYKNPETSPQDENLEKRSQDQMDWGGSRMNAVGPAGTTTLINQNEKGILEQGLFDAMSAHQVADLGSAHSSYREGIYGDQGSTYGA